MAHRQLTHSRSMCQVPPTEEAGTLVQLLLSCRDMDVNWSHIHASSQKVNWPNAIHTCTLGPIFHILFGQTKKGCYSHTSDHGLWTWLVCDCCGLHLCQKVFFHVCFSHMWKFLVTWTCPIVFHLLHVAYTLPWTCKGLPCRERFGFEQHTSNPKAVLASQKNPENKKRRAAIVILKQPQ